jgi:cyclase
VGDLVKTCRVYSDQDTDEIIILNINKGGVEYDDFLDAIKRVSSEVMMPISVGGGINSFEDAERAFRAGADKVVLNSASYDNPGLLKKISSRFGKQAIILSLDYREGDKGLGLLSHGGRVPQKIDISQHVQRLASEGFGELMIQSIDRDGMKSGYDLKTLSQILQNCGMPVIVAGGAGNFSHLHEAFSLGVDAVACGTLFNFGDNSPQRAKAYLRNNGVLLKKWL